MNKELRKAISDEIHRRHGYRFMEAKIKPVHIANSLMRNEHECVGRMVASSIDVNAPPLEYRDFLEVLRQRWSIVVGGTPSDGTLLAQIGAHVPTRELTENSERFLSRLESIGLARSLADSVAVVGLLEDSYE